MDNLKDLGVVIAGGAADIGAATASHKEVSWVSLARVAG